LPGVVVAPAVLPAVALVSPVMPARSVGAVAPVGGVGRVARVGGAVGARVLLVLDPAERDGPVPGRVAADAVAAGVDGEPGDERERLVVLLDRVLVLLPQELEVAGQV